MGLITKPDAVPTLQRFLCEGPDGSLELFVETALLVPKYLRSGEMLVTIEGYGRFRIEFVGFP